MKTIHPLYQKIVEQIIALDKREFQVPEQQRLVVALNYLHGEEGAPSLLDGSFDESEPET